MADEEHIPGFVQPIHFQGADAAKVACKDCAFRDKTTVNVYGKMIPSGVIKAFCEIYEPPPKTNGKPNAVLFHNEPCKYYLKDRTVICFHKPGEEYGYLSNWFLSDFTVNGIPYSSMEQYMMHMKARVFSDAAAADQILHTTNPEVIKALGQSVSNYSDSVWNGMRQLLVYKGLREKFAQNEELKQRLLSTETNYLAECAVHDKIWGIGLSMKDPDRFHIEKWKGKNLLGYTLMIVRSDLAHEKK